MEKIDSNYTPLKWYQKKMKPKKLMAWCNTIKEQKFYEQLFEGMNCMINEKQYICYYPATENRRGNKVLKDMFPFVSATVALEELIEKIGFSNSFESMNVCSLDRGNLKIKVSNGDTIYCDFRKITGINNKFKPIKLK